MKEHYDFSSMKGTANSYTKYLKQPVTVRLLRDGDNQVIHIPREFELSRGEVVLRWEGKRLIIEAAPVGSLLLFLESCEPLDVDFPEIDDSWPVDDVNL